MPTGSNLSVINLDERRRTDTVFGAAYLLLLVVTGVICIAAYARSPNSFSDFERCINATAISVDGDTPGMKQTWPGHLVANMGYLAVALVGSLLLGITWMALLRFFAKPVVYATLLVKGLILIGCGAYLFAEHVSTLAALILCAAGALYFLVLFCLRRRIELTAVLIEQSVNVVAAHPGVFLASACLFVVKVGVLALSVSAYVLIFSSTVNVSQGRCEPGPISTGDKVMYGIVTVFLYWSVQLWLYMGFYVVSLTTGVWYYTHESLAAQEGEVAHKAITRAPVCTSIKLACTKSFGSIAFASLLITICESLKRLAEKERRNGGMIGCLIACCITCILNYLEFLTRFALTFHALTGDDFCTSGKAFLSHARRHGFTAIMVDYLAAMTLQFGAAVLALLVAVCTIGLVSDDGLGADRNVVLPILGLASWVIAAILLVFIAGILLNVVDACYACLVLDLDHASLTGTFHRPAIAEAVIAKVKPTYVIQQPGGTAAIAQPDPHFPPHYVSATAPVVVGEPVLAQQPRSGQRLYPTEP